MTNIKDVKTTMRMSNKALQCIPQGCTQRADHLQSGNPPLEKTSETRERERVQDFTT